MIRSVVFVLCGLLAVLPAAHASADEPGPSRGRVPARATTGPLQASLQREAARLAEAPEALRQTAQWPRARARSSWLSEHPVAACALMGAGVGLLAGLQLQSGECTSANCSAQALIGLPAYGAGVGAGVGLLIKLAR